MTDEIWQFMKDLNNKWVKGHPEKLIDFFHEDMVIMHSVDLRKMGEGREPCIQSYKDFCTHAIIHDFKQMDPDINKYGSTAVVIYSYEITYEMNGEIFHDTGRDFFILIREGDKWLAVWRTIYLYPINQY
jgi:ketosteroid isomerase-like protein